MAWNYATDPFYRALLADLADTRWQITEAEFRASMLARLNQRFLMGEPVPGVMFHHNDVVLVAAGEFIGERGSVISIDSIAEDPALLLELECGQDAIIRQSLLRHSETNHESADPERPIRRGVR